MKKIGLFILSYAMVLGLLVMPVHAETIVASIGEKTYSSLMEAANGAAKGDTIVLEKSVEITTASRLILTGDKYDFTLDLNGYKMTQELNGSVGNTPAPIRLEGSKLTVKDSKGGGEIFGYQTPVGVFRNSSFTLESGILRGEWYGLSGNGMEQGTTIHIKGGTIVNEDPEKTGAAIYHPQTGKLTISGGKMTGDVGIQLCAGNATVLDMSGGTINGTGPDLRKNKKGDGAIPDGAAISVVNRQGYNSIPSVNITGGKFISNQSEAILAYQWKAESGKVGVVSEWAQAREHITITGGTYNTSPSQLIKNNYKVYTINNLFKVAPVTSKIELSASTLNLNVGETVQIKSTLTPSNTLDTISYASSDTKVVTVDNAGKVKAISAGKATITAMAGNKTATCTVMVKEAELPVEPKPEIPTIDTSMPTNEVKVGIQDKASQEIITGSLATVLKNIANGQSVSTSILSTETYKAVQTAIAEGKTVLPRVNAKVVDQKTIALEINHKVNQLISELAKQNNTKATVSEYLDLSVFLVADNQTLGQMNQVSKPITFTIALPTDLQKDGRKFYVVRVHDGKAEKLETTMNADKTLSFQTDRFSTYALVYEDVNKTTVQTNDNNQTMLYLNIGAIALIAGALVMVLKKREELLEK